MIRALTVTLVMLFSGSAAAASLWLVEPERDFALETSLVEELLQELLQHDSSADHIIGAEALAGHISQQNSPPRCIRGAETCDPDSSLLSEWLGVRRTLVVVPEGSGRRIKVHERITGLPEVRTLSVQSDSFRESMLRLVSELQEASSFIDIISEPPGAVVSIGGRELGETPLSSVELDSGNQLLRFELEGYAPLEQSVELLPGERRSVRGELRRTYATLIVLATPAEATLRIGEPLEEAAVGSPIRLTPGQHRIVLEAPDMEPVDEIVRLGTAEDRSIERQLRPTIEYVREQQRLLRRQAQLTLELHGRLSIGSPSWRDARATGSRSGERVACSVNTADPTACDNYGAVGLGFGAGLVYSRWLMDLELLGLGFEGVITRSEGVPFRLEDDTLDEGRGGGRTELRFAHIGLRTFLGDNVEPYGRTGAAMIYETLGKKGGGLPQARRVGLAWQFRLGLRGHINDRVSLNGNVGYSIPLTWKETEPIFSANFGVGIKLTPWARSVAPSLFPSP